MRKEKLQLEIDSERHRSTRGGKAVHTRGQMITGLECQTESNGETPGMSHGTSGGDGFL